MAPPNPSLVDDDVRLVRSVLNQEFVVTIGSVASKLGLSRRRAARGLSILVQKGFARIMPSNAHRSPRCFVATTVITDQRLARHAWDAWLRQSGREQLFKVYNYIVTHPGDSHNDIVAELLAVYKIRRRTSERSLQRLRAAGLLQVRRQVRPSQRALRTTPLGQEPPATPINGYYAMLSPGVPAQPSYDILAESISKSRARIEQFGMSGQWDDDE